MSTYTFDPLTECCKVCEKRVRILDEWMPHGAGIRHARCQPTCRGCGDPFVNEDDVYESESGELYCDDCYESLCSIDEEDE